MREGLKRAAELARSWAGLASYEARKYHERGEPRKGTESLAIARAFEGYAGALDLLLQREITTKTMMVICQKCGAQTPPPE